MLVAEPALHRDHATGVDVHRNESTLRARDLPQAPSQEVFPIFIHQGPNVDNIPKLEIVAKAALGPVNVGARHDGFGRVLCPALDAQPHLAITNLQHDRGAPFSVEVNIPRDRDIGQCCLPIVQLSGINPFARAAPHPLLAVIDFELTAQRHSRNGLHFRVNRRAHGITARKEFSFSKVFAQLPPDFIGEIITRWQFGLEAGKVTVLHRPQWHVCLGQECRPVDVAILHHLLEHKVPTRQEPVLAAHRVVIGRSLGQRGQRRSLVRGQLCQGLVKIGLACGCHPIGVLAQENLIHIKFKDLLLAEGLLDPGGKDDLLDLALGPAVTGQQEIFHHLLGDGGCPAQVAPPCPDRIETSRRNPAQVIAIMGVEIFVLSADKGLFYHVGYRFSGRKQAAFLREFIDDPAFTGIDAADRCRLVLGQRLVTGQIAPVHPQDSTDRQSDHRHRHGHGGENPTEKGQNEPDHDRLHPC